MYTVVGRCFRGIRPVQTQLSWKVQRKEALILRGSKTMRISAPRSCPHLTPFYRKVGYDFLRLGHCFPLGLGTKYGPLRNRGLWLGEFHIWAYILSGCVRYCKRGPISRHVHSNEVFSAHVQSSTTGALNPKPLTHLRALKLNRAFKPDSPSLVM